MWEGDRGRKRKVIKTDRVNANATNRSTGEYCSFTLSICHTLWSLRFNRLLGRAFRSDLLLGRTLRSDQLLGRSLRSDRRTSCMNDILSLPLTLIRPGHIYNMCTTQRKTNVKNKPAQDSSLITSILWGPTWSSGQTIFSWSSGQHGPSHGVECL